MAFFSFIVPIHSICHMIDNNCKNVVKYVLKNNVLLVLMIDVARAFSLISLRKREGGRCIWLRNIPFLCNK